MKRFKKPRRLAKPVSLALQTETIRLLSSSNLSHVAGGISGVLTCDSAHEDTSCDSHERQ
jgi:hypothetical protein